MILKLVHRFCLGQTLITKQLQTTSVRTHIANTMTEVKGLQLEKVVNILEQFAPNSLAESWDNTGLLVEPFTPRLIKKILLTNDLTEDVVVEAKEIGCELIISYHPPIFAPLKSVTQRSWKEKLVSMLLEGGVALYSPHTSWDSVRGGVNDWLASCVTYTSSTPIIVGATPDVGAGRLLRLAEPLVLKEVISNLKTLTDLKHVRVAVARGKNLNSTVDTIALCAGSGASVLKGVAADLYITGEMLHHDVLDATQRGTSVILTNHSDSERGFLKAFQQILTNELAGQAGVFVSSTDKDPLTTV